MKNPFEEKCKELRGVMGDRAEKLRVLYLSATDPDMKRSLESSINLLHATRLKDHEINLQPPSALVSAGDYPLGQVTFNGNELHPFGLRRSELAQHVLISGRSGAGKSNAMLLLAREFIGRE